ncbi:uncharacterized protein LOC142356002, partial [Convolutriloba macropyga]|uniref:uncharacterized protein LOC142356002 n=1 Tax=Convolutriloba macropyga TaxID=536237 RepID=UPI003F51D0CD
MYMHMYMHRHNPGAHFGRPNTAAKNQICIFSKQNPLLYEDSFQRSKSNLCLKTSLTLEKTDAETRHHELMKLRSGRKSGHAKIPPICSPIKYLESSFPYRVPVDSSNRARIDGSWKSREYFDDGESREPSPFAFRRQKSNADMQNYRAQKQMKVAIKIKDANFVAPASTCNTILSTSPVRSQHQLLQHEQVVDETESNDDMDNRVYTMKYTDVSSRNNFSIPIEQQKYHASTDIMSRKRPGPELCLNLESFNLFSFLLQINFFPRGQSLQIKGKYNGSKLDPTNPLTDAITGSLRDDKIAPPQAEAPPPQNHLHQGRPPKGKTSNIRSAPANQNLNIQSNLAPPSGPNSINFIHPDIASEKAAIESLNLLH